MTSTMDVAMNLVRRGVFRVEPDGSIWRDLSNRPMHASKRIDTMAKNGYRLVTFRVEKKQFAVWGHRLIWTALVGEIPPGMEINHKDGNPANNALTNLEVVTPSENKLHSYRVLGRKLSKSIPQPVIARIEQEAKALRAQGLTYVEIGARLGVAQTTAFRAVRAK